MDFTIFDTGDPKSPGSGEPKTTDKAPGKTAAGGPASHAQTGRAAPEDSKKSLPPRPGFYDPDRPRFPRGYLLTVCTLIIENEDAESSRILANLFRALYQDETAFNFAALNQLGALNREHAEKLIAAKLAGAYTPVEWERAFRIIEEYADPYLPTAAANPGAREETTYRDDALANLRGQYPAPPPVAPSKPLPPPEQVQRQPAITVENHAPLTSRLPEQVQRQPAGQAEKQSEKTPPRADLDPERARPRQQFEKPAAVPGASAVRTEPQRSQPSPAERPRSIQQARLTEPTHAPERTQATERQQAPRKIQPPIQRGEPRQNFARTDPPVGFIRTEPPPQFSAGQDRDDRDSRNGPVNFVVPPDSFRQPGNADFGAVRREPIINLDVPLQPDRDTNDEPERGGQDKLMYALLALIIIAALAFVAINYSLFYKGGIPGLGKSAEVSRVPEAQARKVSASAAALSGPVDLMPVSQKTVVPPPRWMAFSAPRQTAQEHSEPSVTPAHTDSLADEPAADISPALTVTTDKPSASVFTAAEAAAEGESASLQSRNRVQGAAARESPARLRESPARFSATRAKAVATRAGAVAPGAGNKAALNDPSAARQTAANTPPDQSYLTFAISPWGDVFVDGRRHGASPPLHRLEIEPGKHIIEIRNGDLTPYRTVVELEPRATVNIRQQFR